jgi:DNA polymerase III subunit delta
MAQKKAFEVEAWLARPDKAASVILLYGADRGLVSERAAAFARRTGLPLQDPFAVIRFDAGELDADPGRLLDEARTISMFGGVRLIWIRGAGAQKSLADAVRILGAEALSDTIVLIEAGDLKKTAPLRVAAEISPHAMALPAYADEERTLTALIETELAAAGKRIEPEAAQLLRGSLGGDRIASRREIEKLLLYCAAKKEISLGDVCASVGDVSAVSADAAVDAAVAGGVADLDHSLTRAVEGGVHPFLILSSTIRQFQALELLRRAVDLEGRNIASAVAAAKPPVFFARRKSVEAATALWTAEAISRALDRLNTTVLETRKRPDLAVALTRQAMLSIAVEANRLARRSKAQANV